MIDILPGQKAEVPRGADPQRLQHHVNSAGLWQANSGVLGDCAGPDRDRRMAAGLAAACLWPPDCHAPCNRPGAGSPTLRACVDARKAGAVVDVLTAAWLAAGRPEVALPGADGACARCRRRAPLVPVRAVISGKFTGWERWADPCGSGVCPSCAWGYRDPVLRRSPTCVTARPPGITHPAPRDLAATLAAPLRQDMALSVPLRPGRKHLLPAAAWGRITTGDAHLAWTQGDAARLDVMTRLRRDGFGSRMLAAPAPAFAVLRRLPQERQRCVLADWAELAAWRSRRPWLDLALHVTAAVAGDR
jgi:hypothetical protein